LTTNTPSPQGAYSLLVIDDEPDLRTLYELTLLREGYEVETAGSVEEALQMLKERSYSAVISDMRLPEGGSGLDVLAYLEQGNRREKAIVITAYGSAENAVEALKAGAFDYLTKPVDLRQFRLVVASALAARRPARRAACRLVWSRAAAAPRRLRPRRLRSQRRRPPRPPPRAWRCRCRVPCRKPRRCAGCRGSRKRWRRCAP
jgi:two-component system, NtrC family, response regulator PilR